MSARSEGPALQEPMVELRSRKLRSATKVTSESVIEASNHIMKQNGKASRLSIQKLEEDCPKIHSEPKIALKNEHEMNRERKIIDLTTKNENEDLLKSEVESLDDPDDFSTVQDDGVDSVTESPGKTSCAKEIQQSSDEAEEDLDEDKNEDSAEDDLGDLSKEPGEDAVREIEPDHLLPFKHGWKREVIVRKGNGQSVTQYEVSYLPPESGQFRTREAKRKRTSKTDQERYFNDFPSSVLSIKNFSYVPRPLGLNNAAYESVKKGPPLETEDIKPPLGSNHRGLQKPASISSRSKGRQVSSYKEMDEISDPLFDEGDSQAEDEEVSAINGFEMSSSIIEQIINHSVGLRAENKKRHVRRDPNTCCTPPVAEDTPWTAMYDDPMGIFNELGGRSSPTTPPPLRAVNLTPLSTCEKIREKFQERKTIAMKFDALQPQTLLENLASHDVAIHRGGIFAQTQYTGLPSTFSAVKRTTNPLLKYSTSLIMKPVLNQMKHPSESLTPNNLRPCSLKCPMAGGTMPDVQCMTCQRFYHAYCQGVSQQTTRMFKCKMCMLGIQDHVGSSSKETIRMKLPMQSVDKERKRPIVELVMLQNGKYQPIKFSNNVQVTEIIPKSMFEQANNLRRPVYQKASQVPKVGNNSIFVAVNPSFKHPGIASHPISSYVDQQRPSHLLKPQGNSQQTSSSEQVSILVKPQAGGKPVLLNVPRRIAVKVKAGTTLSFTANEEKYTVLSNRIHPPVAKKVSGVPSQSITKPTQPSPPTATPSRQFGSTALTLTSMGITKLPSSSVTITPAQPKPSTLPKPLPPSVSLEPVSKNANSLANRKRPAVSVFINRASEPTTKLQKFELPKNVLSSGEIISQSSGLASTPCTPYCPGVSGPPELECSGCQSLFHTKCAGIPPNAVQKIKLAYKCKSCLQRRVTTPSGPVQVIELD